MAEGGEADES
jgi:hypothetical protein